MKTDFRTPLKNLDGTDLMENGAPALIHSKVLDALLMPPTGQGDNSSGTDKVMRYHLAERLYSTQGPVEITTEEASLIKRLVAQFFGPVVVAQTWDLIEGKAVPAGQADPGLAPHTT